MIFVFMTVQGLMGQGLQRMEVYHNGMFLGRYRSIPPEGPEAGRYGCFRSSPGPGVSMPFLVAMKRRREVKAARDPDGGCARRRPRVRGGWQASGFFAPPAPNPQACLMLQERVGASDRRYGVNFKMTMSRQGVCVWNSDHRQRRVFVDGWRYAG